MEKIIRRVLLEYVKELGELDKTEHVDERSKDRLLNANYHVVELRYRDNMGKIVKEDIGTYKLTDKFTNVVSKRIDWLMFDQVKFPNNGRYGIVLGRVKVNLDNVNYYQPENKEKYKNYIEKNDGVLYVKTDYDDKNVNSNGNIVFIIVQNNKMKTLLFERSHEFSSVKQRRDLIEVYDFEEFFQLITKTLF